MKIHDIKQGTDEWHKIRLGKFTASNFSNLFMKKETKGFQNLINQVVFERLTGEVPESFESDYMKRGKELEAIARTSYQLSTFNHVLEIGFIELNEWVGCSPDGLIGEDGLLEIKCPKFSTLIEYHLDGRVPSDYMYQIQGGLYISNRKWCDFYVFHPKMKPLLKRVERNEETIKEIETKLTEVINISKERLNKLGESK
jgi:hypothetical protein